MGALVREIVADAGEAGSLLRDADGAELVELLDLGERALI